MHTAEPADTHAAEWRARYPNRDISRLGTPPPPRFRPAVGDVPAAPITHTGIATRQLGRAFRSDPMHTRGRTVRALVVPAALALAGAARAQTAPLQSHNTVIVRDSGALGLPESGGPIQGTVAQRVWSTEVSVAGASWLRLHLGETTLAGDPDDGTGACLLITSVLDGAQQRLDARSLKEWGGSSAYMNGDAVIVELFVHPGTPPSRIRLVGATAGDPHPVNPESICGVDDRVPRSDPRVGRLLPTGCTAWMPYDGNYVNRFITAGHCVANAQAGLVVEFNVPPSATSGAVVHPPPQSQFPVDPLSIKSTGAAPVGQDAATFQTFSNSNTKLHARIAQGEGAFITLGAALPNNQVLRIDGYGLVETPVSATWNQLGKTHTGPYTGKSGSQIQYRVDTTGGNSGAPVVNNAGDFAFGIHTHGGCDSLPGSFNSGTDYSLPALQTFLASPTGIVAAYDPVVHEVLSTPLTGTNAGNPGGTIFFDLDVLTSQPLRINGLKLNIDNNGAATNLDDPFTFAVYTTPGSAVGKELDINQWTKVAEGYGMPNAEGGYSFGALKVPFDLAQYQSYGMAVVLNAAGGHACTNGNGSNETFSNSELRLTGRSATNGPFSGGFVFSPRVFNGALCTTILEPQGQCEETLFAGNVFTSSGGMVYFDVVTGDDPIHISGIDANVYGVGSQVTAKIYTSPGGRTGKQNNPGAWNLHGTGTGVSAGLNNATHLALNNHFSFNPNTTTGVAVSIETASPLQFGIEATTASGAYLVYTGQHFTMNFGETTPSSFGGAIAAGRVWNARLCYSVDLGSCGLSPLNSNQRPANPTLESRNSNWPCPGVGAQQIADNFSAPEPFMYKRVWLYGVYLGLQVVPPAQAFDINIYADHPTLPGPGALLKSYSISGIVPKDTGGFATGFPPGHRIYVFEIELPTPFIAQANTTYWLSPVGNSCGYTFSWQFAGPGGAYASRPNAQSAWTTLGNAGNFAFAVCGQPNDCEPDCDLSGTLTIADFGCFQTKFVLHDPYADCNNDLQFTIADFGCFQTKFVQGCP